MDEVQVTTVSDCLDTNALDSATVALEKCVDQRGYCVEHIVRSPKSQSPENVGRTRQLGMEHITVHGQQIAFGNERKHQRVQAAMNKSNHSCRNLVAYFSSAVVAATTSKKRRTKAVKGMSKIEQAKESHDKI